MLGLGILVEDQDKRLSSPRTGMRVVSPGSVCMALTGETLENLLMGWWAASMIPGSPVKYIILDWHHEIAHC